MLTEPSFSPAPEPFLRLNRAEYTRPKHKLDLRLEKRGVYTFIWSCSHYKDILDHQGCSHGLYPTSDLLIAEDQNTSEPPTEPGRTKRV
ncbi:hypothetical protein ATANTOWER_002257 [Ataeniobius toweri]|uniref:Rieske domain-containing protein n=1 Tax=Ataeniobius toweri TaxID=208326 RepID=A0ABU7BD98_9TELE|nr:hypothetical protein [Ataeniobius toweri]